MRSHWFSTKFLELLPSLIDITAAIKVAEKALRQSKPPPPPLKAGACFHFIACFYSLMAFIFTIHAFAMLSRCLVWMLLLQMLLRLKNMMTTLLMMPGLQKLIQGNQTKVRMRTLILQKMVIVVMLILLLRLMMLLLLQRIPLMLMWMFLMFVMLQMVLQQMPLFLMRMLLMTLMPLQWRYLRGRSRHNFSKFEKISIVGGGQ